MGSASIGRFGVLFVGLIVGVLLGRLWSETQVLYAAAETKAGVPESLDQVQDMLVVRRDYLSAHAVQIQRELREVEKSAPVLAHYLGLQEVAAAVLLGTLGQLDPRPAFCEHRAALTEVGGLAQTWVCRDGLVCAPDVLRAYQSLAACGGTDSQEVCLEVFRGAAGLPPLRCEELAAQ